MLNSRVWALIRRDSKRHHNSPWGYLSAAAQGWHGKDKQSSYLPLSPSCETSPLRSLFQAFCLFLLFSISFLTLKVEERGRKCDKGLSWLVVSHTGSSPWELGDCLVLTLRRALLWVPRACPPPFPTRTERMVLPLLWVLFSPLIFSCSLRSKVSEVSSTTSSLWSSSGFPDGFFSGQSS